MQSILWGVVSWGITSVLLPGVIALAWRIGALDVPGEARRIHTQSVPRIGGIAIFSAFILICFLSRALTERFWFALAGAAIVFVAGLADDFFEMPAWLKFFFQIVATAFAIGGIENRSWQGAFASLFWILLLTNAHNLIDGMDGLFAGTAVLESLALAVSLAFLGQSPILPLVLAGACFAFYRFNRAPAKIFAGDCGSGSVGFLLGVLSLPLFQFHTWSLGLLASMFVMAYPIVEVFTTILRRALRQKPLFRADRGHLHHLLFDLGFSSSVSGRMLHLVSGVFAILGVLLTRPDLALPGVFACLLCIATLLLTRRYIGRHALWGNIVKRVDFSRKT